jgi:hypothetical protein
VPWCGHIVKCLLAFQFSVFVHVRFQLVNYLLGASFLFASVLLRANEREHDLITHSAGGESWLEVVLCSCVAV